MKTLSAVTAALTLLLALSPPAPAMHTVKSHRCSYANRGIDHGGVVLRLRAYSLPCRVARAVARGVRRHWAKGKGAVDRISIRGWGRLRCDWFAYRGGRFEYACWRTNTKHVTLTHYTR